jgi:ATP-dependent RNA helicase RhlE
MPTEIRRLAEEVLRNPVTVKVAENAPAKAVTHALFPVPLHLKSKLLVKLLEQTDTQSVLVFVRTKHRAKNLARQLNGQGFKVTSLQGNLSQSQRKTAMSGFRDGTFQIMVATDIAARGIDIATISHVINYDMPSTVEAYIHRIGRTGRAAKSGDALTLVVPEDNSMIRSIERVLTRPLQRRTVAGFDYNAGKPEEHSGITARSDTPARRPNGYQRPIGDEQHKREHYNFGSSRRFRRYAGSKRFPKKRHQSVRVMELGS